MEAKAQIHFGPVKNIIMVSDKESVLSVGRDDGLMYESKFPSLDQESSKDLTGITDNLIKSIANGADNKILFTAEGVEGISTISWPSLETNQIISTQQYTDLQMSNNGEYLAAVSVDFNIDIFKTSTNELVGTIKNGNEIVTVKFSQTDEYVVVYDVTNSLIIYEIPSLNQFDTIKIDTLNTLITWANDNLLLACTKSNMLHVYNTRNKTHETEEIGNSGDSIIGIAASKQNNLVFIETSGKLVINKFEHTSDGNFITEKQSVDGEAQDIVSFFEIINSYIFVGDELGAIALNRIDEPEAAVPVQEETQEKELESDVEFVEEHRPVLKPKLPPQEVKGNKLKIPTKEFEPKKRKFIPYKQDVSSDEIVDFSKLSDMEEEEEEGEGGIYDDMAEEVAAPSSDEENLASRMRREAYNDEIEKRRQAFDDWQRQYLEPESESSESSFSDDEVEYLDVDVRKDGKKMTAKERELQYFRSINKIVEKNKKKEKEQKEEEKELKKMIDDGKTGEEEEEAQTEEESSSYYSSYSEEDTGGQTLPFMPGSSRHFDGSRRFLCWNETGVVFLREIDKDREAIDVEFMDNFSNRNISFQNDKHFILATLNKDGFAAASRTFFQYRMNSPHGSPSEFVHRFPDDETIDLIASGRRWVAIATEVGRVHIFTATGFEIGPLSMPDRILTMIGGGDRLLLVYGDTLDFVLLDVSKREKLATGAIPVARPLKWVTIDEKGNVFALGNDKVLIELVYDFGFHWQAVLNVRNAISEGDKYLDSAPESDGDDLGLESAKKAAADDITDFWCVGVNDNKLLGCFLKKNTKVPRAFPLNEISEIPLGPLTVQNGAQSWLQGFTNLANSAKKDRFENMVKLDLESVKMFKDLIDQNEQYKAFEVAKRVRTERARTVVRTLARAKDGCEELSEFVNQYYEADEAMVEEEEEDEPVVQEAPPQANEEEVHEEENYQEDEKVDEEETVKQYDEKVEENVEETHEEEAHEEDKVIEEKKESDDSDVMTNANVPSNTDSEDYHAPEPAKEGSAANDSVAEEKDEGSVAEEYDSVAEDEKDSVADDEKDSVEENDSVVEDDDEKDSVVDDDSIVDE